MEELLEILNKIKPGVDFESEKDLIGGHVLDSFSIIRLVSDLEEEFDITITPLDIIPDNFKSADAIYAMVQRLEDE